MKPAIAIDFDGTVTKDDKFPNIGGENLWLIGKLPTNQDDIGVIKNDRSIIISQGNLYTPATVVIKRMMTRFTIIFHTCRTGEAQTMMIKWLMSEASARMYLTHDYYINNNPFCPEAHEKPFADVYLDNRGLTWHQDLSVEESIDKLMATLPVHAYIPQK